MGIEIVELREQNHSLNRPAVRFLDSNFIVWDLNAVVLAERDFYLRNTAKDLNSVQSGRRAIGKVSLSKSQSRLFDQYGMALKFSS
jgi:hypothetical protein